MKLRALLKNVVNALDFAQGRKTKIGAFIVLVGKLVSQFNPDMGDLIVSLGEWFAAYGLALVVARKLAPPKPGSKPPGPDPMPEQKLSEPNAPTVPGPFDKPYGARNHS